MKIVLKSFAALCFLLAVETIQAQNQIDQFLEKCLASSPEGKTNEGRAACIKATREKWETDIDLCYKALLDATGDREKQLLRMAHNNWMKYKESKFKLLDEHYGEAAGRTIVILEEKKIEFVRQYALEIRNMLSALQSGQFQTGAYN